MVTQNVVFRGGWSMKKFNATVINDIWPEVAFFCLVATGVSLICEKDVADLTLSPQLLTVLGTVLGLVISFRTSSAYERYQDGRKMWTNMQTASRNLAQLVWIHVPLERTDKGEQKKQTSLESVIEKKTVVNLIQAFSVSVKHFLRGEAGVYYEDLYPLVSFLPRYVHGSPGQTDDDMNPLWHSSEDGLHPFDHAASPMVSRTVTAEHGATLVGREPPADNGGFFGSMGRVKRAKTFDPEKALGQVPSHRPLKPARNPPKATLYDYVPIFLIFKPFTRLIRKIRKSTTEESGQTRNILGRRRKPQLGDSNVPLEISLFLSNYVGYIMRAGLVQPAVATNLMSNLGIFQDVLQNLERIGNTPLPFAYQAHLRLSLWLYLFFLPSQIFKSFGYLTIPATAFASFLLLGFLEIGQEIENPFNYDLNDLDLDSFCLTIQRELHETTTHSSPDPTSFMFTAWNQPFAPADRRTAEEIIAAGEDYTGPDNRFKPGMDSLRSTLLKSWKEVDDVTRHHKAFF